jgi:hypothetical protein
MSSARTMSYADRNKLITVRRCAIAVEGVINETPRGAPGALLYVALAPFLSVADFTAMMRVLVEAKRIARQGDRYYPAPGG